ncbi:TauD/TfdA family dioxygenase [Belnapia sp. T6]|uniref:TauD/TfdA family dioxygenase n=1 Tax=Belnapia mucosa TaxID=2804532 RepID=A0ABS1V928_9PROT|nr:TauD/TfdA family dioxygenase [Belnapia mucosa]MBL6458173.1 TauD/TfdA family dioxygenase [Belnapia mucosa]
MSNLNIRPLGFAAGAEVTGLDLCQPLAEADRGAINDAWLRHLVLVFPGQDLTPEQQIAFARNFGELDDHASQAPSTLHPEHREILVLTNKQVGGKPSGTHNSGRNWHTDLSYTERPAKGALLSCKEKPPVGGDTMWANLYLAYETLSPAIRALLEGLEAVHDVTLIKGIEQRDPALVADMKRRNPAVVHPVMRVHPETGRKSLLIGQRIRGFVGMSDEESQSLLSMLNTHATSPEFVYRHRWSVGDLVMWDNRCTCHVALADFDQTKPRVMHRCSLEGEQKTGRIITAAGMGDRASMLQAVAAVS